MSPLLLCRGSYFRRRFLLFRLLHSSSFAAGSIPLACPSLAIYGANTGVGKTLVSAGLAASVISYNSSLLYLKPVQTGFPADSDARFVFRRATDAFRRAQSANASLIASNQCLNVSPAVTKVEEEERVVVGAGDVVGEIVRLKCETLYAWSEAVSAHLAVEREGMAVEDATVVEAVGRWLRAPVGDGSGIDGRSVWRMMETAGGVASPGPSGTLQCDLYRPVRLPAILVGDGRLGGISATISAYETLLIRGYDVIAVILADHGLSNELQLLHYLKNRAHVLVLPTIPCDPSDDLVDWFLDSAPIFDKLQDVILSFHSGRVQRLNDMRKKAKDMLWWPFTQHGLVSEEAVTVIDSRCGENFSIHKVGDAGDMISPQFDACASWWTQGPDSSLQIELARDVGYAAARYGHVMFPENVYEPALKCAELLLRGVGKGWASRVFYSDNGSTAVEVALRMAFRKFSLDHGILSDYEKVLSGERAIEMKVLALSGSYHGDTLGAMEAQAPSPYTSFLQQPWYSGRGLFLDAPSVYMTNRVWNVSLPDCLRKDRPKPAQLCYPLLSDVFCKDRDLSDVADLYSSYISEQLLQYSSPNYSKEKHIGALIIEPVIQGAGGMHMVDPLFQRVLVKESRKRGIPVIYDEVFTGFWRLGMESAAQLIGCVPDVACYAKLMTGGVVPLAATLASEEIFQAFEGDSKLNALLHGHSYTAHAIGCTAAGKAISWFKDPSTNLNIDIDGMKLKELWDEHLVKQLSILPNVQRVVSIGSLCAIELKAEGSNAGYASCYASSLVRQLHNDGIYVRPLGNVIYLMCGPCTSPDICTGLLTKVYDKIRIFEAERETDDKSDGNSREETAAAFTA